MHEPRNPTSGNARGLLKGIAEALAREACGWRDAAAAMADLAECWDELTDAEGEPVEHKPAYVASALGISRRRVEQLRAGGRVLRVLDGMRTSGSHPVAPSSLCERVLRPLAALDDNDAIRAAWEKAIRLAAVQDQRKPLRVTSRQTAQAAKLFLRDPPPAAQEERRLRRVRQALGVLRTEQIDVGELAEALSEETRRCLCDRLAAELGLVVVPAPVARRNGAAAAAAGPFKEQQQQNVADPSRDGSDQAAWIEARYGRAAARKLQDSGADLTRHACADLARIAEACDRKATNPAGLFIRKILDGDRAPPRRGPGPGSWPSCGCRTRRQHEAGCVSLRGAPWDGGAS